MSHGWKYTPLDLSYFIEHVLSKFDVYKEIYDIISFGCREPNLLQMLSNVKFILKSYNFLNSSIIKLFYTFLSLLGDDNFRCCIDSNM